MKFILVLGILTLSTFAYGNNCDFCPITHSVQNFGSYKKYLIKILNAVTASGKGPSYKLVKINSLDKVTVPGDKRVTYAFNVNLKVENREEKYCHVHVRPESMGKKGYFLTFICEGELVFRRLKPSGEVEVITPLTIF